MVKRKFNANRLYRLSAWAVAFLSIGSLILAYKDFRGFTIYEEKYIEESNICDIQYADDKVGWEVCQDLTPATILRLQEEGSQRSYSLLIFGTLLPVVFFGGGAVIRYIFPKTP